MKRIDQQIAQAVAQVARWQDKLKLLHELKAWEGNVPCGTKRTKILPAKGREAGKACTQR